MAAKMPNHVAYYNYMLESSYSVWALARELGAN